MHNDSLAGDNIWGNQVVVSHKKYPYKADLHMEEASGSLVFEDALNPVRLRPLPNLINSHVMWENGQHAAILIYGDLIPDEVIKMNPEFCLYYAWILIVAGKIQKAEPFLTGAESIIKKRILENNLPAETLKYQKTLLGKIAVAFAQMNAMVVRSDTILAYCKTAMENLSEDDPLWYSWAWYSTGIAKLVLDPF